MKTVYEWYRWAKQQLERHEIEDAAFEAQMLASYAFGVDRQTVFLQEKTVPHAKHTEPDLKRRKIT